MLKNKYCSESFTGKDIIILDKGKKNGLFWVIFNCGTHPTAYIEIPSTHPLFGKDCSEINLPVHGGVTYSSDRLVRNDRNYKTWWIGWDYAHAGDRIGDIVSGKEWTTEEIREEVFEMVERLNVYEG